MESKYLLDGEMILAESNDKTVTLTNYRIQYNGFSSGKAQFVSIMLDKVSSIEINYSSKIYLLYFGFLLILAGVSLDGIKVQLTFLGIGLGSFFILLFLLTRKHVVSIASDGGTKISFKTKGMKQDVLLEFVNKIDSAKNKMKS